MMSPRLFIVAGPNGSGKSLFSKVLTASDFDVFDGDKHMTDLSAKFAETPSKDLWNYINNTVFAKEKESAIRSRLNYAYETNFSSDQPMASAREFRENGYEIHLIFMGLNSIEESIERVLFRVQTGGHKVSEISIRYNYKHGFENLYKYFHEFDSIILFDNSIPSDESPSIPREILHIVDNELYLLAERAPEWALPIISEFKTGIPSSPTK